MAENDGNDKSHDKKPQLNIRFNSQEERELFSWFKAFCQAPLVKKMDLKQEGVVKRLLAHVRRLDDDGESTEIEYLLSGKGGGLPLMDKILEQVCWGHHASQSRMLTWALQEFETLRAQAGARGMRPLERFAQFRLVHCWIDLADLLRRNGLRESVQSSADEYFKVSLEVLGDALTIGKRLADESEHRIFRYNLACIYSMLAQVNTERVLASGGQAKPLIDAMNRHRDGLSDEKEFSGSVHKFWEDQKGDWTSVVNRSPGLLDTVKEHARAALDSLKLIGQQQDAYPETSGFIYEFAAHDPELVFLRANKLFEDEFKKWREAGLVNSEKSLLVAVKKLRGDKGLSLPEVEIKPNVGITPPS